MRKTLFIKNALILTVSSLVLRFAGIIFKVWLAARIGSEGIGLYQLIFSVYMLASTFASSGICTAVTRLAAEELALGTKKGTLKILRRCIQLTLIMAAASAAVLFFGADIIALKFLGDARAVIPIKILPLSLPFMGMTSCLRGYFIARRRIKRACRKLRGGGFRGRSRGNFLIPYAVFHLAARPQKADRTFRQRAPALWHCSTGLTYFRAHNIRQIFKHGAPHSGKYTCA